MVPLLWSNRTPCQDEFGRLANELKTAIQRIFKEAQRLSREPHAEGVQLIVGVVRLQLQLVSPSVQLCIPCHMRCVWRNIRTIIANRLRIGCELVANQSAHYRESVANLSAHPCEFLANRLYTFANPSRIRLRTCREPVANPLRTYPRIRCILLFMLC